MGRKGGARRSLVCYSAEPDSEYPKSEAIRVAAAKIASGIATANRWPLTMKYETPSAIPFAKTAGDRPYETLRAKPVEARYKPADPRIPNMTTPASAEGLEIWEVVAAMPRYKTSPAMMADSIRSRKTAAWRKVSVEGRRDSIGGC
jgi:hypothetical protein